ncbi:MAG: ComEA family DNA-binding protein [Candidatus Tectimicrobiota bacterium]
MDKGSMPMEKGGMGKAGMPMEKGSMGKAGTGMEKGGMGKASMADKKATASMPPLDLNTADEAALKSLQGIGPARARAIVVYRQQHGPFQSVDELAKVPGIGKKTLAGMKDRLTIGKGL